MKVYVAIYDCEYGRDARVFVNKSCAEAWRDDIARNWWDTEFGDEEMPDLRVGEAYFEMMQESCGYVETFCIEECELEGEPK